MPESTSERLARLLALVTYLSEHDDVPVAELAEHFAVSRAQILRDIDTLWVSGTPGYQPDDLLDFSSDAYDAQRIALTNARGMDRPLRLGTTEAVSLVVALRAMQSLPGLADTPALTTALAKLTAAVGDAAAGAEKVSLEPRTEPLAQRVAEHAAIVREAMRTGTRLRLTYVSAADETTTRLVDPLELTSDGDYSYLRAWCLRADAVRHFRLDRFLDLVPDGEAQPHPEAGEAGTSLRPEDAALRVTLTLTPRSRWVAERYGGTVTAEGESLEVELDVASTAWLTQLVLDLGADVLALQPDTLARDIAARATRALAAYEEEVA